MESPHAPPDRERPRAAAATALALGATLLLGFALYAPGQSGGFQLDDYSNLGSLQVLNDSPGTDELAQFFLKGISSPLGRPLSLLSFAVQAPDWPDHPGSFIRFNILLHLLNGVLLFWWLSQLGRLRGGGPVGEHYVPLAVTALWLLAPIQASSVLYVVQRMTELAATFVFLGMGLYLAGRARLDEGRTGAGLAWMSLGLAVGAGLGTLAKESAAQMPLMVLALEATLLAARPPPRAWRRWAVPCLALPALALLAYVAWIGFTGAGFNGRAFTPLERLLTEPRVLFLYLYKTLGPWPTGIRLWYDDFPISTGLLTPWTTLPALLALLAAGVAAWRARRRLPLAAFAVLWFLASHVLESSALPLELVFEHRNYMAAAGVWLALAGGFAGLLQRASSRQARNVLAALAAVYVASLGLVTMQIATLWGRPLELSALMAQRLPESKRAALGFAGMLMRERLPYDAAVQAYRATRRWPEDPSFPLLTVTLACQLAEVGFPDTADLERRLATAPDTLVNAVVDNLDGLVSLLEGRHCPIGLPVPLTRYTGTALANPQLGNQRQNLLLLHSRALAVEGRFAEARDTFRQAVDVRPQMILLIQGALDAVNGGDLALARHYVARLREDPRIRARDRWSHRNDIPLLEELVRSREAADR